MTDVITKTGVKIDVDRELCYGFGDCVDTLPDVFALDEENKAIVVEASGASVDDLIDASQNCPVDAIILTDAESGSQIYP